MANIILTDAFISVGGNVLSSFGNGVTLDYSVDTPDDTVWGDTTKSVMGGGLRDWSLKLDFNQDFAAGAIDSILWPLIGTAVAFEIRPSSAAVSASNPKYTGTGILGGYSPLSGKPGDKAAISVSLKPGGATPNLTRATA